MRWLKKTFLYFKKKVIHFLVAYLGLFLIRIILLTCKKEVRGIASFLNLAKKERCVLVFWHNRILLLPFFLSKYAKNFFYSAFVSQSRDGQLISSVTKKYPTAKVITVPHSARHHALKMMIRSLKDGEIILITPDGPQGPRYQVKPGTILGAKQANAYVIPLSWTTTRFWQLKTWDKMIIPKPFSKIIIEWGKPLSFSKEEKMSSSQEIQVLEKALWNGSKKLNEELIKNPENFP